MGMEYGDSLIYYPTIKLQCLDVRSKGIPILFRGTRINPVYPFTEDRKCTTLTSIKEDGMVYHNL